MILVTHPFKWHYAETLSLTHFKVLLIASMMDHHYPNLLVDLQIFFQGESAIKLDHYRDYVARFRPGGPKIYELSEMFHTSKHQWYPKYVIQSLYQFCEVVFCKSPSTDIGNSETLRKTDGTIGQPAADSQPEGI